MRGAAAAAAAAVLALGLAACGDDDDTDEEGAPAADDGGTASDDGGAAGGDNAAFCDGIVEFNGMVMNVQIDETSSEEEVSEAGEQLSAAFAPVAEGAPDELSDAASTIDSALQDLAGGDAEAFNADDTFMTYTELSAGAIDACEFETVDVAGVDYGYEGVPSTIPAGTVAFRFANESDTEEHEMAILKKADGVQLSWEELVELPEEEAMTKAEFLGAAFAPPGGDSGTFAELSPGEYAMICFIPVGGSEDGPPHFTQGMLQEFTVE
jgi:hypothetical protein